MLFEDMMPFLQQGNTIVLPSNEEYDYGDCAYTIQDIFVRPDKNEVTILLGQRCYTNDLNRVNV